jgi:predicted transcriptional regulator
VHELRDLDPVHGDLGQPVRRESAYRPYITTQGIKAVDSRPASLYPESVMEVHFNPHIQAQLDRLASESGRSKEEFVQDAMAGYFEELAQLREMLDRRYDDLKSGRVKPIPGDEVQAHFAAKSAAHRSRRS